MSTIKTARNDSGVEDFLNNVEDEAKRKDSIKILALMKKITNAQPEMWGDSIIGFGSYHYKYESGTEGDWFLTGFSPRKQNLSLYIMAGFTSHEKLLGKLGKHKTGKACLYIKRLSDIDMNILEQIIKASVKRIKEKYG